jgi:hypothetical protein
MKKILQNCSKASPLSFSEGRLAILSSSSFHFDTPFIKDESIELFPIDFNIT